MDSRLYYVFSRLDILCPRLEHVIQVCRDQNTVVNSDSEQRYESDPYSHREVEPHKIQEPYASGKRHGYSDEYEDALDNRSEIHIYKHKIYEEADGNKHNQLLLCPDLVLKLSRPLEEIPLREFYLFFRSLRGLLHKSDHVAAAHVHQDIGAKQAVLRIYHGRACHKIYVRELCYGNLCAARRGNEDAFQGVG